MTLKELQQKYPIFEYKSFKYEIDGEDLVCSWVMEAGELKYNPKLIIHQGGPKAAGLSKIELDNLVFHLGLADIFSYWKPTCSPEIRISAGKLTDDQISWWHDLLIKGMGQYFYTNAIDFKTPNFVTITSSGPDLGFELNEPADGLLIPVGGGKDSAVTLELLKNKEARVGAFSMNLAYQAEMQPSSKRLMNIAGIKEQYFTERILDKKLWELRERDYLHGHIPFSAYLFFLSALTARIFGYSQVAFSNERSSNEGNVDYLGEEVNHQYSKSYEFENKFSRYNQSYLSNVNIFSFLKPLFELQIMKIFSQEDMRKYYTRFRSCNVGYKSDSWCGSCPKCLSVFVGLFPFVKTEILVDIFGKNLFEDPKLLDLAKDVLGLGNGKPFECIGTYEETVVAFYLSSKKYSGQALPPLLAYFSDNQAILEQKLGDLDELAKKVLGSFDDNNALPLDFSQNLKEIYFK